MPGRRMEVKIIREILRLKSLNLSTTKIGRSVNKARSSVNDMVRKAREAGLKWPLPEDLDDQKLEELLYVKPEVTPEGKVLPDFSYINRELTKKGVTRQLLWEEYKEANKGKDCYSYTRLCELYDIWRKKNRPPSMRQVHKAGEKCFVDYTGLTVDIKDPLTGEVIKAQIFVGVMGASNYIFAEATASQSLESWLGSHTRMLEFFGRVPEIIVPDNLKSGVTRACRYDPDTNAAYAQWANHYRTIIIPARPRKPRDKGKAEKAVQIVETSVLGGGGLIRKIVAENMCRQSYVVDNIIQGRKRRSFLRKKQTFYSLFDKEIPDVLKSVLRGKKKEVLLFTFDRNYRSFIP